MGSETHGHRYFEGLAVAHVLGGLDETDGRVFRSHLLECSDCRARVGELRALAHDLADVERDERRVRAAKTIETKRRERAEEEEDAAVPPVPAPGPRYPRLLAVAGMLALVGLALWNYTLRDALSNQEAIVDNVTEAAELLQMGQVVSDVQILADGVDATVHVREDRAALLVTGLPEDTVHGIFQMDSDDDVVYVEPHRSRNQRLFVLVPLRPETRQVWVTRPHGDEGNPRDDTHVVTAVLPNGR